MQTSTFRLVAWTVVSFLTVATCLADTITVEEDISGYGAYYGPPYLYTWIVWPSEVSNTERVLRLLQEDSFMVIRAVFHIVWTPTREAWVRNYVRFYRRPENEMAAKAAECVPQLFHTSTHRSSSSFAANYFVLIILEDKKPQFGTAFVRLVGPGRPIKPTNQVCNKRMNNLKVRVRHDALSRKNTHCVHCTVDAVEFNRDVLMLLGVTAQELKTALQAAWGDTWDGTKIVTVERDCSGSSGWSTLAEVFKILNGCMRYAVLRNFENLPDSQLYGKHSDIDILVDDQWEFELVANVMEVKRGFQAFTLVAGEKIQWDVRPVTGAYYKREWMKYMLQRRVFSEKEFFHLAPVDYFYSLLWHAVFQKPHINPDYIPRLLSLAPAAGLRDWSPATFEDKHKKIYSGVNIVLPISLII